MPLPKVLIFSKKPADRDLLTRILGREKYHFVWTDNGPETIIQVLSGSVEAVVIFLQQKGHRELEYIPCLNSIDEKLPIVVISARDSLKLQREIRQNRVFYYLPQPVESREIKAVLKDALNSAVKSR